MGKPTGFLEFTRSVPPCQEPQQRVQHYQEFTEKTPPDLIASQSARCMDCGIPFCHHGCPLGNIIPEFNDAVYREQWQEALEILSSTNNFPEFTGRICPAPCESSCVLGINQSPVAIEFIEKTIIEKGFESGYITPNPPQKRTGKKIAIVGSGPSGLAASAQLNKAGHQIVVFERAAQPGGLLRYGIPDFKLEKKIVQRRIDMLIAEGITFNCGVNVGVDVGIEELEKQFDVVILALGSTVPRPIQGMGAVKGVHFAMDFLSQQNSRNANMQEIKNHRGEIVNEIQATNKHVVVIGGGDTGSDCVGTSIRQKATSILQIEVLEKPPTKRSEKTPWPQWPYMLRTSSSHEEGVQREWAVSVQEFISDEKGSLQSIRLKKMGWHEIEGKQVWREIEKSDFIIPCDLALIAAGFLHPEQTGIIERLQLEKNPNNNIKTNAIYQSSNPKIFVAGDCRRGQSLVVWAISEGRECAYHVDRFLMGDSTLERKDQRYNPSL